MSPKKIGRPMIGITRKEHRLQLRLNDEELRALDDCAAALKTTRTDVVNRGIQLVKESLDTAK